MREVEIQNRVINSAFFHQISLQVLRMYLQAAGFVLVFFILCVDKHLDNSM